MIDLTKSSLCPSSLSTAKDKGERLQQSGTNLTQTAVITKATVERLTASELRVLQLETQIFTPPSRCLTSKLLVYA